MRRAGGAPLPAPAVARQALTLELAGAGVALESSDPGWLRVVGERYASFLAEVEPTFAVELIADAGPHDAGPATSSRAPWLREDGDEAFAVRGPWLAVGADLRRGRGEVRGAPDPAGVELLLRHLVPCLVGDGLVLHAAGLADASGAWACCGPSGSGKSTLAALLPAHALCDELVAIRRSGDAFVLEALPFARARRADQAWQKVRRPHTRMNAQLGEGHAHLRVGDRDAHVAG